MANAWNVAGMGWGVTVLGWFLSPIIGLLLNKFLSYLGFDASEKLRELEIHTIPKLKQTLREVEEERILREARKERSNVETLNKLASMLRSALYEAEDILDLIDYHQIEKKVVGDGESHDCSWLRRLYDAVGACVARCSRSWLGRCVHINGGRSAALLRWAQQSLCWLGRCVRATLRRSAALLPISRAPSVSSVQRIPCWSRSFDFRNCCRSIFAWSANAVAVARSYRNWSYEEVGITSYQDVGSKSSWTMPGPLKGCLKETLKKIEKHIDEAQKIIGLANLPSDHRPEVTAKYIQKPTAADPPRKVTGRDEDRRQIISMLRDTENDDNPSSSGGKSFSVIGIHGIPGSGKTTLAQYVCKHEANASYFHLVMWVHVSQNFRVETIFSEMIEQATKKPCPQFKGLTALQEHLKEELRGKRFLLVLDDVWYNEGLSQEELSPLEVGEAGSRILVTSRTSDALLALGAVRWIPIPDLDEHAFIELFMHYALEGARLDGQDRRILKTIGVDIAKRLKRSPLLAGTVGGQLRIRLNVDFWRRVRDQDVLTDPTGALWWSYQHLDEQARRCFAYCSIFPRRYQLKRDELVNFWVAEGFIKTTEIGEEMEGIAQGYFDELVSTSFLQLGGKDYQNRDYYTIHDLLHDLAEEVAGSDCFRIENGWTGEVPPDVRHLFVETCNRALLAEKILKLENLRTLVIHSNAMKENIEDEDLESMFTKLRKLRILSVSLERKYTRFSVSASVGQLKHIRYLAINMAGLFKLILPSTFTKLYHMQVLGCGSCGEFVSYPGQDMMSNLINLRHILTSGSHLDLPNIIRLTSLQTLPAFNVRKEPGYELRQLRDLNKLRGRLGISGLENVGSKEEALEANLASKERLTELHLEWPEWGLRGRLRSSNADLEAEILEGLCPPMGLEELIIDSYKGSRYPDWMVGNKNGPKHLQQLELCFCSQPLGAIPGRNEFFVHLRVLKIKFCRWDALPDNMELLTSLKELFIVYCENIRSLPTLPRSLEYLNIEYCNDVFTWSCETIGDPNWQKIEHVPNKDIY